MKDIHNAAFRKRLIQFIRESEELVQREQSVENVQDRSFVSYT